MAKFLQFWHGLRTTLAAQSNKSPVINNVLPLFLFSDVFKEDPEYLENEDKYKTLKKGKTYLFLIITAFFHFTITNTFLILTTFFKQPILYNGKEFARIMQ